MKAGNEKRKGKCGRTGKEIEMACILERKMKYFRANAIFYQEG
jgi:hypothetical protein